jgi:predicted nuclease of restriction endonuclease-like RecB superfamily
VKEHPNTKSATGGDSIVLTKDQLRFRIVKGVVKPRFVDPQDAGLLQLAGEMLAVFQLNTTRAEIAEAIEPALSCIPDRKLGRGLEKLLHDRSKFGQPADRDFASFRAHAFAESAKRLSRAGDFEFEAYREAVAKSLGSDGVEGLPVADGLDPYEDLPEYERLVRFKELYPQQLLERYNCSLVQSLLLHARSLTLTIDEPEPANLRRLVKYLKFFRLLAVIYRDEGSAAARKKKKKRGTDENRLRIVIDGPATVLGNTSKYGLQLASFFPAVCSLTKWRLETTVLVRNGQEVALVADQKLGLVSPYRNFSVHVPEEISMFHRHFKEKVDDWQVVGETPFIDAGEQKLVFPDFSFENEQNDRVHLELFHRWHGTQLLQRLLFGAANPELPLIIGVDRSLLKKPEVEDAVNGSAWFEQHGFLFRDYPTVVKVRKCLDSVIFP